MKVDTDRVMVILKKNEFKFHVNSEVILIMPVEKAGIDQWYNALRQTVPFIFSKILL